MNRVNADTGKRPEFRHKNRLPQLPPLDTSTRLNNKSIDKSNYNNHNKWGNGTGTEGGRIDIGNESVASVSARAGPSTARSAPATAMTATTPALASTVLTPSSTTEATTIASTPKSTTMKTTGLPMMTHNATSVRSGNVTLKDGILSSNTNAPSSSTTFSPVNIIYGNQSRLPSPIPSLSPSSRVAARVGTINERRSMTKSNIKTPLAITIHKMKPGTSTVSPSSLPSISKHAKASTYSQSQPILSTPSGISNATTGSSKHRCASILPVPRSKSLGSNSASSVLQHSQQERGELGQGYETRRQGVNRLCILNLPEIPRIAASPTETDITAVESPTTTETTATPSMAAECKAETIVRYQDLAAGLDHQLDHYTDREREVVARNGGMVDVSDAQSQYTQQTELLTFPPRDVDALSCLQAATQTVSDMEARLQELEHDCKSIPLYEQERAEMLEVLQGMELTAKKDQEWIEQTEITVRWTTHILEEALHSPECNLNQFDEIRVSYNDNNNDQYTLDASENIIDGDDEKKRFQKNWGLVVDPKTPLSSPGATYKTGIMTALQHLESIDSSVLNRKTKVSKGKNAIYAAGGCEVFHDIIDHGVNSRNGEVVSKLGKVKSSIKSMTTDNALQNWLENTSIGNLDIQSESKSAACTMDTDASDREREQNGSVDKDVQTQRKAPSRKPIIPIRSPEISPNCVVAGPLTETKLESEAEKETELASGPAPGPGTESKLELDLRLQPSSALDSTLAPYAAHRSHQNLSTASIQATLSDSTQSLQTDLGGCMLDERVYLKQHIQALSRKRLEEQLRTQRVEQGHQQLITDLVRFSKELLGGTNELTCAQAMLIEAIELTQMILETMKKFDVETVVVDGKSNGIELSKQKGLIAGSSKELSKSVDKIEQGIKHVKRLAADCVGITELAQRQKEAGEAPGSSATAPFRHAPASVSTMGAFMPLSSNALSCSQIVNLQNNSMAIAQVHSPSSMFVDGIGFQEFEGHLASLRSTFNGMPKRALTTPDLLSNPSLASSTSVNSLLMTPFMKRVLADDIYPCLLIHPKSTTTKPGGGGWISSLRSSSLSAPSFSLSYGSGPLTPWLQLLLYAMEKNACEIELWKTTAATVSQTRGSHLNIGGGASFQKAPCCLCGIVRLCEFRLRIPDQELNSTLSNGSTLFKKKGFSSLHSDNKPRRYNHRRHNQQSLSLPSALRRAYGSGSLNDNSQDYCPLDRFCRDRVVAVCDFYMFLAHLRQGLLDHQPNLELFRRAVSLRQRIACARIGSMDIAQGQETGPLSMAMATRQ
ncbi:hypothetical protein BG011_007659 [Mortierella polycephala]|uniref:Uncharacterized protein n=1 Tax=Mortierella polycephala TaxID=41804 RepID=A0A9P6QHF5_9FUNG|nr:hypothetical protein BG011_007659 [Mortierella polycephala]